MLTIKDFSKLYALLFVKNKQMKKINTKEKQKRRSVPLKAFGGAFTARAGQALVISKLYVVYLFVCFNF